jgi:hypothetical protein
MVDTWYTPDELADEADGDQTQPEFDPAPTPGYDDVEEIGDAEMAATVVAYTDALRTTIAGFTQDYPTVSAPSFSSGFSNGFNRAA